MISNLSDPVENTPCAFPPVGFSVNTAFSERFPPLVLFCRLCVYPRRRRLSFGLWPTLTASPFSSSSSLSAKLDQ
jgi:hypothetical protein